MQLRRNTSIGKSRGWMILGIKFFALILFLFICIILISKIDFPYPNKKIEKIIPNENFKKIK